jgi:hypothetical protein
MYFKNFPKFIYEFKSGNTNKTSLVKDITRNIRFRRDLLATVTVYDEYDIVDGETPEIIAEKIYGDPQYHWIIMLANDRYDYIEDFPLAEYQLTKVISSKYPGTENNVHHYVDARGFVVNSTAPGAVSISNSDYERTKNEQKRRIKIISLNIIDTVLKDYRDLI